MCGGGCCCCRRPLPVRVPLRFEAAAAGRVGTSWNANDANERELNLSIDDSEPQRARMFCWNYRSGLPLVASRAAVPEKSSSGFVERGGIIAEVRFVFIRVTRVQTRWGQPAARRRPGRIRPFTRYVVGIFLTVLCFGARARHELLRVCTNPHSVDASHPREADVRFAGPPHIVYRNLPLVGRRDESFQDHSRVANTILDVAPSATVSTLLRGRPPPKTGRYPAN